MTGSLTVTIGLDPSVENLMRDAAMAAADAGLVDGAERIVGLAKRTDDILTAEHRRGGLWLVLRPFAELLLREVVDIARSTLDAATKDQRIAEAFRLAGLG